MIYKQTAYMPQNKMRDLIRDNSQLLMTISRFDIAFGFGDSTVEQTCASNDVDTDTFLAVSNLLSGAPYNSASISLLSLMAYLKRAHSSILDITLPNIRHRLIEAINYSESNDAAFLLMKFFDDYVVEVRRHMEHENNEIFKYVEDLLNGTADISYKISQFSGNHTHMASKLKELKDIFISHYTQKDNARLASVLFDIIQCERDLMAHFEIENRLFLPAVETLEHKYHTDPVKSAVSADDTEESSALSTLGEREKDIIRCVAEGKSNKEIADKLCISIHTVTTHRRNICSKLDIHSSAGLAIFAIINHLVDLKDINPQQA